jgi:hypothetical protein
MRNLYAAVMVLETGYPIAFHMDAFVQATDYDSGSREGIWWLPNGTAKDFLVLTNQSAQALQVTLRLFDATGRVSVQQIVLKPQNTFRNSVRDLAKAAGLVGTYGGLKIDAPSKVGSLDTAYLLFDETAGFSSVMKTFGRDPQGKLGQRLGFPKVNTWTTRAPMLALSSPDPSLGFPSATVLQPEIFVRNTTGDPVSAALRFNWHTDTNNGSSVGPILQLAPYATQLVDVGALQKNQVIPPNAHWASVEITSTGLPNDIMATAASYDTTLRYGAQTPFNDQLTFHWEGGEWQVDATHNSIITAGNGGNIPITAQFTIYYNSGQQRYDLEQQLQPHEQMWVDVGKLIREQVPDKIGLVLPLNLMMGSYELQDLTDPAFGNLFEGKVIVDKTFGHVAYGCAECCGLATVPWMLYNPMDVTPGQQSPQDVWDIDYCTQKNASILYDILSSSWTTGSSSIATAKSAVITGIAEGTTTDSASGTITTGRPDSRSCPPASIFPIGNVDVPPVILAISPPDGLIGNTVNISISGTGFGSAPAVLAPSGITTAVKSSSDKQITATLTISTSLSGGNVSIQVENTQTELTSAGANFFVQVPTTQVRSPDYGTNGLGPINVITDGSVINIYGTTELTNQCGVYEIIGYQLVDQRKPAQYIYGNYDLHEQFSNYTSTVQGQQAPLAQDNPIVISQVVLGDTQYYGKTAPSCPGSNDNEQFDQSFSVIIQGKTYPLTMVNTIARGFYSGTGNVTVTIKTP